MDSRLMSEWEWIAFHPMVSTHTVAISKADMMRFIELSGHEPMIVNFSELVSAPAQAPAPKKGENKKAEK
jgi:hypothetical protein